MKVGVELDIIEFEDDGLQYFYSPALDLIGYGNTWQQAKESGELVLMEYFNYTTSKKNFDKRFRKTWMANS